MFLGAMMRNSTGRVRMTAGGASKQHDGATPPANHMIGNLGCRTCCAKTCANKDNFPDGGVARARGRHLRRGGVSRRNGEAIRRPVRVVFFRVRSKINLRSIVESKQIEDNRSERGWRYALRIEFPSQQVARGGGTNSDSKTG